MQETIFDFRSDTVTRPSPAMREAMAAAEVGDDVMEEDPTVNRLEARAAELCGREAALFVPTGTMANLVCMALHCGRGDEAILERRTHSFSHEVAGAAALFGISMNIQDSPDGMLTPEQVARAIRPDDIHEPASRLVIMENTANLAGGRVIPPAQVRAMRELTSTRNMRLHIDGARIFNAAVAAGASVRDYAAQADTMSFCLSKGLGCPAGSMVIGDRDHIIRARKLRKMLGGGMRQAGVLAACGLYALENNIDRLADDHALAREVADSLRKVLDERYLVREPETNILLVQTDSKATTDKTIGEWKDRGILALALNDTTIRLVTHMDLPKSSAECFSILPR